MRKSLFLFLSMLLYVTLISGQEDTLQVNYWNSPPDSATVKAITKVSEVLKDTAVKAASEKPQTVYRPELIVISGGGYNSASSDRSGFGFAEAKMMCKLFNGLRIGPYGGYIQYSSRGFSPKSTLLGKEWKAGLAFDSYGFVTKTLSWYSWLNSSYGRCRDRYQQVPYESLTHTGLLSFSWGLSLSDGLNGWFTHNQLMLDYQRPIGKISLTATWKGKALDDEKPYSKESYHAVLESGVKRFYVGRGSEIEPIVHLGYGHDYGDSKNYREYGLGFGFGFFRDWYRDIFKVKAFWKDGKDSGGRLNGEVVLNVTSLVKVLVGK